MGGPYEEAQPLALPASTGAVANSRPGSYLGFTVRETAGAAATVDLYDSTTGTGLGAPLETISLGASGAAGDNYSHPGRLVISGLWAVITGSIKGSVFQ